ncbi:flagellar hook-associated protein 2 [Oxalobacteraceae bacterium GrIS 1.11]
MLNSAIGNNPNGGAPSGISADVYARVEQVMSAQNKGAVKLNAALTRDQTKLSALGQVRTALSAFQAIAQRLAGAGLSTSATSSAKDVLSASANGQAVGGTYAVEVKQLARGQTLLGAVQAGADSPIGTGAPAVIKVEFGSVDGKDFTPGAPKSGKTITIDSGNNTLQGMAAAFKAAGIDAQVVKSGNGFALALAGQSGAANSMRISVSGDAAVKDLLSYNPAGGKGGLSQTLAAQDALLSVDGKAVKSASNSVATALVGATLNLTATGTTSVVVAKDPGQIAANVAGLVSAYNHLNGQLQTLQKGDLKSDTALGQVGNQLTQVLQSGALAGAGVSVDKSGNLALDNAKLKAAIAANPEAVAKLFTNGGVADQFAAKITALTGDSGSLQRETVAVGKEVGALNVKKAVLTKALTAQANALVKLYSQQDQAGGPTSLFDFMA